MVNAKGTYILILALNEDTTVTVGRLATITFPPGYYLYAGSALGGLFPRIRRHIRGGTNFHWHIDYLRRVAELVEIWYVISDKRLECIWYRTAANMRQARLPVNGFGSSGCTCRSHLVFFTSRPSFLEFRRSLVDRTQDLRRICV